jgi:hypothetical protein
MRNLRFEGFDPKLQLQAGLIELFEAKFLLYVTRTMKGVPPAVAGDRFALIHYPDLLLAIEGIKITF